MADINHMKPQMSMKEQTSHAMSLRTVLKPGRYLVEVEDTKLREANSGAGILEVTLKVLENEHGEQFNQRVWDNIYVSGQSDKAKEIGWARYATLCEAAGFDDYPSDTNNLVGYEAMADIDVGEARSTQYDPSNEVKRYYPVPKNRPKTGSTASASGGGYNKAFDNDDIPF